MGAKALHQVVFSLALAALAFGQQAAPQAPPEPVASTAIEILADHDSRYKIAGMKEPAITVHAGQPVTLRITAVKAKDHARDGAIHGFALLRAKDRSRVAGWDFRLMPGVHEFMLNAPAEPGEYVVVCTVICSPDHEGMHMKFVVLP